MLLQVNYEWKHISTITFLQSTLLDYGIKPHALYICGFGFFRKIHMAGYLINNGKYICMPLRSMIWEMKALAGSVSGKGTFTVFKWKIEESKNSWHTQFLLALLQQKYQKLLISSKMAKSNISTMIGEFQYKAWRWCIQNLWTSSQCSEKHEALVSGRIFTVFPL